jgi:hypothetical protein
MSRISEGKDNLSRTMADINTDYRYHMNILQTQAQDAAKQMNLAAQSRQAASDTMNGYIQQVLAMIPQVEAAYARAGQAGSAALSSGQVSRAPTYSSQNPMGVVGTAELSRQMPRPINITANSIVQLDGREITRQTREYRIEDDDNAGVNLIR